MSRQTSIPRTDVDHPEIRDAIERWLEACERAEAATKKRDELDDAIVLKQLDLGVSYHPYTDRKTGKRKYRVVDTTPRGKSLSARPAPDDIAPDEPEVSESTPMEKATSRKVSRKSAAKEIAAEQERMRVADEVVDPSIAQSNAAVDGALRPGRDWDAEA